MRAIDALLAGCFVLIWGAAFNAAKVVVSDWPPLWALAVRFTLTAPLLLGLMLLRRHHLPRGADLLRVTGMGLLGTGGYLALSWSAATHVASGITALISACSPLFVAMGEVLFLGQRLGPMAWGGLGLGWLGVAVLGIGRAGAGLGAGEGLGFALALCGALAQGAGILLFAPARGRVDLWAASFGQSAVSAGLLVLAGVLEGAPPVAIAPATALALGYCILLSGVIGYGIMFALFQRLPASTVTALQLLAPPVAVLLGWGFLGERLGWSDLAGGAVTLTGLLLLLRARVRPAGRG
ncbi:DMT family transporter [Roseomonas gilardii subsp. gilardii]|uniref:DMT family transporter n=1 Tax=Roseomonas gilardii TaxID=257708 RepID=UPI001FF8E979|nr:EamA family transporter [Roseomonas gilardii]UPG72910.1 DMT family transporter [Roseomonas gilardii subsp. gilardii]